MHEANVFDKFSGSQLLSGGHECVLVKWKYNSKEREYLPRLRAPIDHVICSPDNQIFVTCHQDNCRLLVAVISFLSFFLTVSQCKFNFRFS